MLGDTFFAIEKITLGGGSDTYTGGILDVSGGNGNDTMTGGGGTQTLRGGQGSDTLNGAADNDALFGDAGDDVLIGGAGADTLNGGTNTDTASYETANGGVTVNLLDTSLNTGDALGDTYSSIEAFKLSNRADTFVGSAVADIVRGLGGANTLNGNGGDDVLFSGAGADAFNGGANVDTVNYGDSAGGITLSFGNPASNTGFAAGDTFVSIEKFILTSGADLFFGASAADNADGGTGADNLNGLGGNDTLLGGFGNDTLIGGAGSDTLDGGGNSGGEGDIVFYTAGVTIDLLNQAANAGDAAGDTLLNIETFNFSAGADIFNGNNNAQTVRGGNGGDTLRGFGGADLLFGESGNDIIDGGDQNDRVDGGLGDDSLRGGGGADTFVWTKDQGDDVIQDFNPGQSGEKIELHGLGTIHDRNGLELIMRNSGNDVIIDPGWPFVGQTLTIKNVQQADLFSNDFVFF